MLQKVSKQGISIIPTVGLLFSGTIISFSAVQLPYIGNHPRKKNFANHLLGIVHEKTIAIHKKNDLGVVLSRMTRTFFRAGA